MPVLFIHSKILSISIFDLIVILLVYDLFDISNITSQGYIFLITININNYEYLSNIIIINKLYNILRSNLTHRLST